MIQCPVCQHDELEGEVFCAECGARLFPAWARSAGAKAAGPAAASPLASPARPGGVAPADQNPIFTTRAARPLTGPTGPAGSPGRLGPLPLPAGEPQPPLARLGGLRPGQVTLSVAGKGEPILLPDRPEWVLGRGADLGHAPDLDLSAQGAKGHGVSRRHARLALGPGGLLVTDLGSTNGTFVNGVRLAPGEPTRLSSGAELALGRLVLIVSFAA
jgi:hypothetical protein